MSESSDPDLPPWEEPDAVRRDYLPHRGGMLHVLGAISLVTGALSLCCVPLAFVGLPLGIFVWSSALRDLKEFQTGTLDPRGIQVTSEALLFGRAGTIAASIGLVIWGYILSVAL